MIIERKYISLCEETLNINDCKKNNFETFKIRISNYLDNIKNLIDLDLNKLSDYEFCDLISDIYNIYIEESDYIKILSKKNKKIITAILRKELTKKKILEDMQATIDELELDITKTLEQTRNKKNIYETIKICEEWFYTSKQKEYNAIKLNIKKKRLI